MKKIIICVMPMSNAIRKTVYHGTDRSLPSSEKEMYFPSLSFLDTSLTPEDELVVLQINKKTVEAHPQKPSTLFKEELDEIVKDKNFGTKVEYREIESEFAEDAFVHQKLLRDIIQNVPDDGHIIADITFGPKDTPIVIFSALRFAEKFLSCSIENIIYGQAYFKPDGTFDKALLCDMSPLFSLDSFTDVVKCSNSDQARTILNTLVL